MELIRKIQNAEVVITIGRDGIETIKDREGECKKLDLAGVLIILIDYEKENLKPMINKWIDKLKIYRTFS